MGSSCTDQFTVQLPSHSLGVCGHVPQSVPFPSAFLPFACHVGNTPLLQIITVTSYYEADTRLPVRYTWVLPISLEEYEQEVKEEEYLDAFMPRGKEGGGQTIHLVYYLTNHIEYYISLTSVISCWILLDK